MRFHAFASIGWSLLTLTGCSSGAESAASDETTADLSRIRALATIAEAGNQSPKYLAEPKDGIGWYVAESKMTHESTPLVLRGASLTEGGDCSLNYSVLLSDDVVVLLTKWASCAVDMPMGIDVDSVFFKDQTPLTAFHAYQPPPGDTGSAKVTPIVEAPPLACATKFAEAIKAVDIKKLQQLSCEIGG
jgi:hypothetical protein